MVEVFREVRRVLRDDGTLWLNLGDSYAGKQLCGRQIAASHGPTGTSSQPPNTDPNPKGVRTLSTDICTPLVGSHVVYVDERGRPQNAVVNAVWPDMSGPDEPPGVNLVYVDPEEGSRDAYGRQVARDTSVVHETNQAAPGRFWRWPD